MNNQALIKINPTFMSKAGLNTIWFGRKFEMGTLITKEIWNTLGTELKKELVLTKFREVNELYQYSSLYGAYEDIFTMIDEECIDGEDLEYELEKFAEEVIFKEYSENDLREMTKHFSISKLED